jgi:hypothetical protein
MIKVFLPNTWAYEDFITDEEQKSLLDFAFSIRSRLQNNGNGRFYADHVVSRLKPPKEFLHVKQRIIETENFIDYEIDSIFEDFLSFNEDGGAIHKHKDQNHPNRIHTRYNLLLSLPEEGGNPIYDGKVIQIKEKMIWRCEAGLYNHASLPVKGTKPRINISFGFQLKPIK